MHCHQVEIERRSGPLLHELNSGTALFGVIYEKRFEIPFAIHILLLTTNNFG